MAFAIGFAICLLIGVLAQAWKKRTGALWFFLTATLFVVFGAVSYYSVELHSPDLLDHDAGHQAIALVVFGGGGLLMLLVVASLPKRTSQ